MVPFVHTGMQDLMPIGSKFPTVSKKVSFFIRLPSTSSDLLLPSVVVAAFICFFELWMEFLTYFLINSVSQFSSALLSSF